MSALPTTTYCGRTVIAGGEALGIFRTPGRFGWDGGFGTSAYTDPAEGMIGILFTQRMLDSPEPPLYSSYKPSNHRTQKY